VFKFTFEGSIAPIAYFVFCILLFIFKKDYKILDLKFQKKSFFNLAFILLLLTLVLSLGAYFQVLESWCLVYFTGAFFFVWLVDKLKFPVYFGQALTLFLSILACLSFNPDSAVQRASAVIAGVSLASIYTANYKISLVPLTWLVTLIWLPQENAISTQNLFLTLISISLFVQRLLQIKFFQEDKKYFKRSALILASAFVSYLFVQNILLAPKLTNLAWAFASGMIANLLIVLLEENKIEITPFLALLIFGLTSLVSLRTLGTNGLLAVSVSTLVFVNAKYLPIATMFFLGRVLVQVFSLQYNSNITGINLMHPYVYAAQFAGLALGIIIIYALSKLKSNTIIFTLFITLIALSANFFLHEEATASLYLSFLVSAICLSLLLEPLLKEANNFVDNLIVYPFTAIGLSLLFGGVFNLGNEATKFIKLLVLAVVLVISLSLLFIQRKLSSGELISVSSD
jgi:hypothetical protein